MNDQEKLSQDIQMVMERMRAALEEPGSTANHLGYSERKFLRQRYEEDVQVTKHWAAELRALGMDESAKEMDQLTTQAMALVRKFGSAEGLGN